MKVLVRYLKVSLLEMGGGEMGNSVHVMEGGFSKCTLPHTRGEGVNFCHGGAYMLNEWPVISSHKNE